MKAVVAAFNQALVGAFSVITNLRMELFEALVAVCSFYVADVFNFLPESYALPAERRGLVAAMKQGAAGAGVWIVKPSCRSCGQGISLVTRTIDLPSKWSRAPYCVQRYIANPLLIHDTKFDLRLYVLLTSIDPVR